jgi:hypothetical protein
VYGFLAFVIIECVCVRACVRVRARAHAFICHDVGSCQDPHGSALWLGTAHVRRDVRNPCCEVGVLVTSSVWNVSIDVMAC